MIETATGARAHAGLVRAGLSLVLLALLAACGDGGLQAERNWMDGVRQQARVSVTKVAEPKKFTPFTYGAKDSVDPFSPTKLTVALAKQQSSSASAFKPDMTRRREALEAYPLDALHMVGTLQQKGLNYALVQADKSLYQTKVGSYIGQNFGMITAISDTEISIKEVAQDASGEWVERKSKLELQETKK
ncbi:MAG: pilus assembly protein PilP [Herminiimonas sp.]|nr:pilus assembly protein PilP [Herminiimonas sp.]